MPVMEAALDLADRDIWPHFELPGATGHIGREGAHGSDHLLLTCCCQRCGDAVLAALWHSCKGHHDQCAGALQTALFTKHSITLAPCLCLSCLACKQLQAPPMLL